MKLSSRVECPAYNGKHFQETNDLYKLYIIMLLSFGSTNSTYAHIVSLFTNTHTSKAEVKYSDIQAWENKVSQNWPRGKQFDNLPTNKHLTQLADSDLRW